MILPGCVGPAVGDLCMPLTLTSEKLTAWLRLSLTPGIGAVQAQRLLKHFSSPLAIDQCSAAQLAARLPNTVCEKLLLARDPPITQLISEALRWAQAADQTLLTPDQPSYPALLKHTADAPLVIYAKGHLKQLLKPAIAIVGARHATPDGIENAHRFARDLAARGWCVVSGLAQGIDAAAHRGAITASQGPGAASTIAVFGTGADLIYPRSHAGLVHQILSSGGLILSEFPLGTPARPHHFPRRNRIVAGLSRGVLVVEAAIKSGSLLTAKLAVDLDRDVFAIPGSIHSPLSRGPHALIQEGARLAESANDILSELRAFCVSQTSFEIRPDLSNSATETQAPEMARSQPLSPVWHAIGYDPITEETLQQRTNMLPSILQCELLTLELNGDIERRPNGRIVRARQRPLSSDIPNA
jgi:DNA processing protein